jgi:hypothetical protein
MRNLPSRCARWVSRTPAAPSFRRTPGTASSTRARTSTAPRTAGGAHALVEPLRDRHIRSSSAARLRSSRTCQSQPERVASGHVRGAESTYGHEDDRPPHPREAPLRRAEGPPPAARAAGAARGLAVAPAAGVRVPGHRRVALDGGRQAALRQAVGDEARRPPRAWRLLRPRHVHDRGDRRRAAGRDDDRAEGGAEGEDRRAPRPGADEPRGRDARRTRDRERAAHPAGPRATRDPLHRWPRERRARHRARRRGAAPRGKPRPGHALRLRGGRGPGAPARPLDEGEGELRVRAEPRASRSWCGRHPA